jgi:sugar lactone lactonase YvrE
MIASRNVAAHIALRVFRTLTAAIAVVAMALPGGALSQTITTVAGNGVQGFAGDGGPATSASLHTPIDVATDAAGNLYIADPGNDRIRMVAAGTGIITTVAGSGISGFAGDGGPATSASLGFPYGVAVDAAGNLYIADLYNNRIRKVAVGTGIITTVAGNGTEGFAGDGGPATSASLNLPSGVAVDAAGNLYIADGVNNRIRKVAVGTGIITTVAGNGTRGFAGDGGPATGASLRVSSGVAVDAAGNLYIAEGTDIRKVAVETGIITTVVGNGVVGGFGGDGGPATSASLGGASDVAVDAAGNLYIADTGNYRIRIVAADTGIITTVAGNGTRGFAGDGGPATSASLHTPYGVATDAAGNVFIADYGNERIRKVSKEFALSVLATGAGTVSSNPAGIDCGLTCTANFRAGSTVTLSAAAGGGSVFAGWTGSGCSGTGTCTVTMNAATSVNAMFVIQAGTPTAMANPASVDFGGQSMGTTSPAQTVTIVNVGVGTLGPISVSVNNAQFAQTNNCTSLVSGASCTVNVTFSPTILAGALLSTASVSGSLSITSNGNGSPNSVPLTGTAEKSLVSHYYRSILRRAPDSGGKAFWEGETSRLQAIANVNETWYAMAGSFYTSPEYLAFNRDDTGFVTDLYNTFFNRAPDAVGLASWTGQLGSGMPREVALVSFMFSAEFVSFTQAIFGNTAVRTEMDTVVDFYRGLMSRLPDTTGFGFWLGRFRMAQCQGASAVKAQAESISSAFALSAEYLGRNRTNAEYVGDLYNSFLRRGGDLTGVQFWINEIASGRRTREYVRQQFIASTEFTNRVNAIIAQGCSPTIVINFETSPGPDGLLGTADDIPAPSPCSACRPLSALGYGAVGVTFTSGTLFDGSLFPNHGPNNHFSSSSVPDATLSTPVYGIRLSSYSVWNLTLYAFDSSGAILATNTFTNPSGGTFALSQLQVYSNGLPIARFTARPEGCAPSAGSCDNILNIDDIVLETVPIN